MASSPRNKAPSIRLTFGSRQRQKSGGCSSLVHAPMIAKRSCIGLRRKPWGNFLLIGALPLQRQQRTPPLPPSGPYNDTSSSSPAYPTWLVRHPQAKSKCLEWTGLTKGQSSINKRDNYFLALSRQLLTVSVIVAGEQALPGLGALRVLIIVRVWGRGGERGMGSQGWWHLLKSHVLDPLAEAEYRKQIPTIDW